LAQFTNGPYSFGWSNVAAGAYVLTASATDNDGATTLSSAVNVTVNTNQFPAVTITAPTNGAAYFAPVDIAVNATATDADGRIVLLELFADSLKLGQV